MEPLERNTQGRLTFPLVLTAFIVAFGSSFPHGWNTGVLNAPSHLIIQFINDSYSDRYEAPLTPNLLDILWSITVAIYLAGGCIGAFSVRWTADRIGRKKSLLFFHIFGFASAVLFGCCEVANSFEMLMVARLVVGIGCGAGSGLVPMYLTEISPVNYRGSMGVIHQFALTLGILVSQIIGLRQVLGNPEAWPYLLALTSAPCVVSLVVLPFLPESPRYLLLNHGHPEEARKALKVYRGHDDVEADIEEMVEEYEHQKSEPDWTFRKLFRSHVLRLPLFLVCAINMCQQLSGINVVFYYSTTIFESAGIPLDNIQYAVLGTGVINVVMTGISVPLMEKSGRRPLLLGGMIVMIISATVITVALNIQDTVQWMSYISIVCVITFVIGFAIGLGSIPQFIGAELFKQGPRPPAMALGQLLNWLCNFLVAVGFPSLETAMKAFVFIIFIIIVLVFEVIFWWKLPETKNKTYEEIYRGFAKTKSDLAEIEEDLHITGGEQMKPIYTPPGNIHNGSTVDSHEKIPLKTDAV